MAPLSVGDLTYQEPGYEAIYVHIHRCICIYDMHMQMFILSVHDLCGEMYLSHSIASPPRPPTHKCIVSESMYCNSVQTWYVETCAYTQHMLLSLGMRLYMYAYTDAYVYAHMYMHICVCTCLYYLYMMKRICLVLLQLKVMVN